MSDALGKGLVTPDGGDPAPPAASPHGDAVMIALNHTLAELLARLCVELETDDPVGVMSRALGLLDMVQHTKRQGGRLVFQNQRGELADVVF